MMLITVSILITTMVINVDAVYVDRYACTNVCAYNSLLYTDMYTGRHIAMQVHVDAYLSCCSCSAVTENPKRLPYRRQQNFEDL